MLNFFASSINELGRAGIQSSEKVIHPAVLGIVPVNPETCLDVYQFSLAVEFVFMIK